jgi:heme-degrading monooxygenase HmoA
MFVIREQFTAKPGHASKLAAMFKDLLGSIPGHKYRVLTDQIADFNTVVIETDVQDLGEFGKLMEEYGQRADIREKMKGYTEMYVTGKREVYKVV